MKNDINFENLEKGLLDISVLVSKFAKVNRVTLLDDGTTPESDTDHTVMLSISACAIASKLYPELNVGKIAEYAAVHDLVEAYAGDTNTFNITDEERSAKDLRELQAFEKIKSEFQNSYEWIIDTMKDYDAQADDEARLVKLMDKVMTKLTQKVNGGAYFTLHNITREEARHHLTSQVEILENKYGSRFPEIIIIIKSLSDKIMKESFNSDTLFS